MNNAQLVNSRYQALLPRAQTAMLVLTVEIARPLHACSVLLETMRPALVCQRAFSVLLGRMRQQLVCLHVLIATLVLTVEIRPVHVCSVLWVPTQAVHPCQRVFSVQQGGMRQQPV